MRNMNMRIFQAILPTFGCNRPPCHSSIVPARGQCACGTSHPALPTATLSLPAAPTQLTASISWCVLSVTASSWVNSTNCGGRPWLPSGDVSEASIAAAGREQQKGV